MRHSLIALLAVCHADTAAAITLTLDSAAFSSTISQIEDHVDPVTWGTVRKSPQIPRENTDPGGKVSENGCFADFFSANP